MKKVYEFYIDIKFLRDENISFSNNYGNDPLHYNLYNVSGDEGGYSSYSPYSRILRKSKQHDMNPNLFLYAWTPNKEYADEFQYRTRNMNVFKKYIRKLSDEEFDVYKKERSDFGLEYYPFITKSIINGVVECYDGAKILCTYIESHTIVSWGMDILTYYLNNDKGGRFSQYIGEDITILVTDKLRRALNTLYFSSIVNFKYNGYYTLSNVSSDREDLEINEGVFYPPIYLDEVSLFIKVFYKTLSKEV